MKNLSKLAKTYILFTIIAGVVLLTWFFLQLQVKDPILLIVLIVTASLTHMFKVEGPTKRSNYQISFVVYGLSLVMVGPAQTALVITIAHLVEWVWYRYPWYIQSFNLGSFILTLGATSLIYNAFNLNPESIDLVGILGMLLTVAGFTLVNHFLVGLVLFLARGENFKESEVFAWLNLLIDFTLLGLGLAAGVSWAQSPYTIIFFLVPIYLIYMTLKVPSLKRQSITDTKTGLYNVRYFNEVMANELARIKRFNHPLTVVMGDLDFFRNINNTYGHPAGDKVLVKVAEILKEGIRNYDVVARFGGEEFLILMVETSPEDAYARIETIRKEVAATILQVQNSAEPIRVTISFGLAGSEDGSLTGQEIINNADLAVYQAKANGRNCTVLYSKDGGYQQLETSEAPVQKPARLPTANPRLVKSKQPAAQEPQKPETKSPKEKKLLPEWMQNLFIASILLFALAVTLCALPFPVDVDWVGLAVFGAIVLIAEVFSVEIYVKDTAVSTSASVMVAGFIYFGPAGVLVLSLVQAGSAMVKYRSQLKRFFFNFGNQVFAGMLGFLAVRLTLGDFTQQPVLIEILGTLLMAGIIYATTTVLLSVVIFLSSGETPARVWNERFRWLGLFYLAMGLVSFAFIFSYRASGLVGVLIVLVPLMMLRLSQKEYLDRTTQAVTQLRSSLDELRKRSEEISRLNNTLLMTLSRVIDARDPYTLGHSQNVAHYAACIAQRIGLGNDQVELVRKAALLHDIGKLGIPEAVLWKVGELTKREHEQLMRHPKMGSMIIGDIPTLKPIIPAILHHHERFDGKGYPDGLTGEEIPLMARILAVADSADAMSSNRPYRKKYERLEVLEELKKNAGTQFDPTIVKVFLSILAAEGEPVPVEQQALLNEEPAAG